jgi:hypothetical protein
MSDASPHDSPGRIGRRANPRVRLGIPARLLLLGSNARCLLDNLSRSGARLTLDNPPRPSESAVLQCEGLEAFCTVVRVEGRVCAVRFMPALDERNVCGMRSVADHYAEHMREAIEGRARDWITGASKMF